MDLLDQRGTMTAGALAEALGLSPSAVTTVLDRLEQRRYVRRLPHPDDRRQVLVALTPLLYRRPRELYGDGSYSNGVRHVNVPDPDGNTIVFAEPLDAASASPPSAVTGEVR